MSTPRVPTAALTRFIQVDITVGPDITASNWNTSATGTDLNFDAAWPLGVVHWVCEFHRQH